MKKILFYPGAFNPPHYGHVALIRAAMNHMHFDEVWIMPSGRRDDGKIISISYADRRNLNTLFTEYLKDKEHIPAVLITTELDDKEDVGTKETIRQIKATPNMAITQLIGSDAYKRILECKLIVDGEKFLVFRRAGDTTNYESNESAHFLTIELPDISSTIIRGLVHHHNDGYKKLIPQEIGEYIESSNLYK